MKQAYDEVSNAIEKDWKNVWTNGVKEIEIEFFGLTMEIVNRQLIKYEEELRWVLKTNLFTFVIDHVLEGKGSNVIR